MCGRYSFVTTAEKVKLQFGKGFKTGVNLRTTYNLAPTQFGYVVTNDKPDRLQYFSWGLIPAWSRDGKNSGKLINARQEGIASKPSFRLPVRSQRCLVLADSFYEWKKVGKEKVPHRIFLKSGQLLALAGIWDTWNKGDLPINTYSIITTEPNQEMKPIHNRMPVVLESPEQQSHWLEAAALNDHLALLKTPPDDILTMYPISKMVGSVRNNSPEIHLREEAPPTLFD